MDKVSQVVRFREHAYARERRSSWLKLGMAMAVFVSLVIVAASLLVMGYAVNLTRDLPSIAKLPSMLETPNGSLLHPTRIMDRSGVHVLLTLEDPRAAKKQYIYVSPEGQAGVNQASSYLVNATVLEYDPDFWNNPGFKLNGIVEGLHPTIAQSLVSNLLLTDEQPSLIRSIRERVLAAQLISHYGREKVLEWYLNNAWYGGTIYGAEAAAQIYFGKPAADISFAEVAMLVAISEKPSIDPLSGSQLLNQQQELIIKKMLVKGLVTGIEAQQALKEEVHFQPKTATQSVAPSFTGLVLDQISKVIPLERLYRGGYVIITTLDYTLQAQVDCAVRVYLSRLTDEPAPTSTLDGSTCESSAWLPSSVSGVNRILAEQNVEVVVVDPQSGQILSMVGQADDALTPTPPVTHQVGTILSPFLYLTAFTRGMSPATLLWDIPPSEGASLSESTQFLPAENTLESYHGPVSLRQAMINDYRGAAFEVLKQVNIKNVITTEEQFGIDTGEISKLADPSLIDLASQNASLLETVQAYAVLANQGVMVGEASQMTDQDILIDTLQPTSILAIKEVNGLVSLDWMESQQIPVTSPQLAYLTTHVLADEKSRWESLGHPNGLEIDRPTAGKVSLTDDASDAWAVGYIPQMVVGVWMGTSTQNMGQMNTNIPAGLWHAVMSYAAHRIPEEEFSIPGGVTRLQVCVPSGMLPTLLCPIINQEVFLEGNVPTQVDDLYQQYLIDRETGYLATIFTSSDLVEDKVFINIPQEARGWAKTAGLSIPPDTYDSISIPVESSPTVAITVPVMFSHITGKVDIEGNAGGEGFLYYRLEVGKGLNPHEWLQIGEDVSNPVDNGALVTWDTSGLKGLYVVKLLVVYEDMHFNEAYLQVTVDNTPPVVSILSPEEAEFFIFHSGETILLNASASDDLDVDRVDFYVDNRLVSTITAAPYIRLWDASVGTHTLTIKAYDLAGNESQASVTFKVNK